MQVAGDEAEQGEARHVGPVEVVEHQHERMAAAGPSEQGRDALEETEADLVIGEPWFRRPRRCALRRLGQ